VDIFPDFSEIRSNKFCRYVGIITYYGNSGIILQRGIKSQNGIDYEIGPPIKPAVFQILIFAGTGKNSEKCVDLH
jgi:hypothetical protein